MSDMTVGRQLRATADSAQWQQLESQVGLDEQFAAVDNLAARLLVASLRGNDPVTAQLARGRDGSDAVQLYRVSDGERTWLDEHMPVTAHQARGGWWLPEQVAVNAGLCNLASLVRRDGRYGVAAAVDMTAKVDARDADAMFAAMVLQPVAEAVLTPLLLRSGAAGKHTVPREKAWGELTKLYYDLALDGGEPLAEMLPGPRWRQLDADEQDRVRVPLIDTLLEQVTVSTVARLRARQLRVLVDAIYAKAKAGTPMPLARGILTPRPTSRTLPPGSAATGLSSSAGSASSPTRASSSSPPSQRRTCSSSACSVECTSR